MFRFFRSRDRTLIFLAMLTTGMASMLYEVVLISFAAATVGTTEVSSALIIAGFLLGLAVGSAIGGNLSKRNVSYVFVLVGAEVLIALYGFSLFGIVKILNVFTLSGVALYAFLAIALLLPTTLMGIEIPLAVRILNRESEASGQDVGFVYTADTAGGVLGALFTGVLFIPLLGLQGSMYLGGSLNVVTALLVFTLAVPPQKLVAKVLYGCALALTSLGSWFLAAGSDFSGEANARLFGLLPQSTTLVEAVHSPYQYIMVIDHPIYGNTLLLNSKFQIAERDSLSYHEFLVLPALAAHPNPEKALVIGGGDGGTLYQLLEADVQNITHVDLDERVIEISREHLPLAHRGALDDPRVTRVVADGRQFLESSDDAFDVIVLDLPSPHFIKLEVLYSQEFYRIARASLNEGGILVTQASSPYYFLEAHTAILNTISSVLTHVHSYTVPISSMSSEGYIVASDAYDPRTVRNVNIVSRKWYNPKYHEGLFHHPPFLEHFYAENDLPISTDARPVLYQLLEPRYKGRGILDTREHGQRW